jgi:hypothetical protein
MIDVESSWSIATNITRHVFKKCHDARYASQIIAVSGVCRLHNLASDGGSPRQIGLYRAIKPAPALDVLLALVRLIDGSRA